MTGQSRLHERSESAELQLRSIASDLRLATVADIARALSAPLSQQQLLDLIMDKLTRALDADRSTLFLYQDGELWSTVAQGTEARVIRIQVGQGLAGWVAATGRGLNIKDAYQDSRFNATWDQEFGFRTESVLCQPVFDRDGNLVAVVQVLNKHNGWFTVEDESLLRTIVAMAAISIVNGQLHSELMVRHAELNKAHKDLKDKTAEIDLLFELERMAGTAGSMQELVARLIGPIAATVDLGVVEIAIALPENIVELHRCGQGSNGGRLTLLLSEGEGFVGCAMEADGVIDLDQLKPAQIAELARAEQMARLPRAGLALPLEEDGQVLGALAAFDPLDRSERITQEDRKLLSLVSKQVARVLAERRARDQAERDDRLSAIGSALAGVLHDFRTPMTVASGAVQMLKREDDATERAHLADDVLQQLDRMMQMTREVLAFARGETELLPHKVQLGDFSKEIEELTRQIMIGSHVQVTLQCHDRGLARLDTQKILRVVQNIARNAREALAGRTDGRMSIELKADGTQLVLTFADNGPGASDEIRHRMFQAFATHGKSDGTGLGLALVKQVAEAHGGQVSYRDTPGGGATFEVRLERDVTAKAPTA